MTQFVSPRFVQLFLLLAWHIGNFTMLEVPGIVTCADFLTRCISMLSATYILRELVSNLLGRRGMNTNKSKAICRACGCFEHPEEHGHECRFCRKRFRHADPRCHRTVKVDDICPRCNPTEEGISC